MSDHTGDHRSVASVLKSLEAQFSTFEGRLHAHEKRMDGFAAELRDIREDKLGQKDMLVAIATGLSAIHNRLGPMSIVYNDIPSRLAGIEIEIKKVQEHLMARPCMVRGVDANCPVCNSQKE